MKFGRRDRRGTTPSGIEIERVDANATTNGSTPAVAMASIVAAIASSLKEAGFRKRRHTFNRHVGDDGFVQVLNFQMGAFDPPGTVEIPGLRPNLYGRFTVNLGVFVPAIHRGGLTARDWYSDYHCQLRKRIGELLPERADVWWRLDNPNAEADVADAILNQGLPWLARFTGYAELLDVWNEDGGSAVGLGFPAAPLDIADVLLHLGRRPEARAILGEYVGRDHAGGHREVLRKYLADRDFEELARRIS